MIINLDSNGNSIWASIFEYNKTYDSYGDMAQYESIVYSSLFVEGYPCFLSVNSTNGKYIQSNMFTTVVHKVTDGREIMIRIATSKYIFGLVRGYGQYDYYNSRLFVLSRDTLLPLLIFNLFKPYSFYPIFIDNEDVIAKFVLISENRFDIISININLEIVTCFGFSINNDILSTNNMKLFKTYDENTAYFLTNQRYNSSLTDQYSTTILSRTNIYLDSINCDYIYLNKSVEQN